VGCGYGYLSYLLAFTSEERIITGIDYDEEKVELARHCIAKPNNVEFVCADAVNYNFGTADVFVLSDVLHYLSDEDQEKVLRNCFSGLNPGGLVMVRDADSDLQKRHLGTRYTEFFSTSFGFNKTSSSQLNFFSGKKIIQIAGRYGMHTEIIDNTRLTSNLLYIMRRD